VAANAVMAFLQLKRLRVGFNGRLEGAQTAMITARILIASALLAGVSWGVWYLLDRLLGRSLPAQIVSVGGATAAGIWLYARAVLAMHIPEAHQVHRLILTQLGRA
jgi:putative peptidoglycan lipid II flippase